MYKIYYFLQDLPKEIKYAWQRVKRGWSDRDVWDFNDYLSEVIAGGIKKLSKDKCGYPNDSTPKKWDKDLKEMVKGFEAWDKMHEVDFTRLGWRQKYKKYEKEFKKGMELFVKHFNSLWD